MSATHVFASYFICAALETRRTIVPMIAHVVVGAVDVDGDPLVLATPEDIVGPQDVDIVVTGY